MVSVTDVDCRLSIDRINSCTTGDLSPRHVCVIWKEVMMEMIFKEILILVQCFVTSVSFHLAMRQVIQSYLYVVYYFFC